MARFEVHELEGTKYVDVILDNESIRAEAGALCYMTGNISITSRLIPEFTSAIRAMLTDEAIYRPVYTGSGTITLESSLGGFHILDLNNESWILERGAYWSSEMSVDVSYKRENVLTSLWAGEGLIFLQTMISGTGKVVLATRGPIEEIQLEQGKEVVAEGQYVVARTADVSMKIRRATSNYFGSVTSGEGLVRVFAGTGRILLNPSPYWRYRIMSEKSVGKHQPTLLS